MNIHQLAYLLQIKSESVAKKRNEMLASDRQNNLIKKLNELVVALDLLSIFLTTDQSAILVENFKKAKETIAELPDIDQQFKISALIKESERAAFPSKEELEAASKEQEKQIEKFKKQAMDFKMFIEAKKQRGENKVENNNKSELNPTFCRIL